MAVALAGLIAPAEVAVADRTRHTIAARLLPFLFILYITNYLDRTSVAYAALGMSRDLGFSDRVFGMGAGIFFISYVALQIPGALLVAGWILGHKWFAVEGWRWLFVLEGMPAILLGVVAFFYLADWPGEAGWLAPERRQWIKQKLEEEKPSHWAAITIAQTLHSRTVLLLAAAVFLDYFTGYAVIFWLPTVLKRQSGFSDMRVGLLGAVPYAVAL